MLRWQVGRHSRPQNSLLTQAITERTHAHGFDEKSRVATVPQLPDPMRVDAIELGAIWCQTVELHGTYFYCLKQNGKYARLVAILVHHEKRITLGQGGALIIHPAYWLVIQRWALGDAQALTPGSVLKWPRKVGQTHFYGSDINAAIGFGSCLARFPPSAVPGLDGGQARLHIGVSILSFLETEDGRTAKQRARWCYLARGAVEGQRLLCA